MFFSMCPTDFLRSAVFLAKVADWFFRKIQYVWYSAVKNCDTNERNAISSDRDATLGTL